MKPTLWRSLFAGVAVTTVLAYYLPGPDLLAIVLSVVIGFGVAVLVDRVCS